MKVTLLKKIGDHSVGDEIEVQDETVLEAWKNLGVIEGEAKERELSDFKVDELKALAVEMNLPEEDWKSLKKDELVQYLTDK